jgi:hypothetical protein
MGGRWARCAEGSDCQGTSVEGGWQGSSAVASPPACSQCPGRASLCRAGGWGKGGRRSRALQPPPPRLAPCAHPCFRRPVPAPTHPPVATTVVETAVSAAPGQVVVNPAMATLVSVSAAEKAAMAEELQTPALVPLRVQSASARPTCVRKGVGTARGIGLGSYRCGMPGSDYMGSATAGAQGVRGEGTRGQVPLRDDLWTLRDRARPCPPHCPPCWR